ncbi:uncharacterized protein [Apostichopus japonicus]|uniref:uncharacterized protein isoform X2 n=1 Tax=Stichopus japonicus TaxID=307972 RepID=UPI003AB51DF4
MVWSGLFSSHGSTIEKIMIIFRTAIYLPFCIAILYISSVASTTTPPQNIYAAIGSVLNLNCTVTSKLNRAWDFNDEPLYLGKIPTEEWIGISISLLEDYSLRFHELSSIHEGVYVCRQGVYILATYEVIIQVRPRLKMSINGKPAINSTVFIADGKEANVSCFAEGARPEVNLLWRGLSEANWEIIYVSYNTSQGIKDTFDASSDIVIVPRSATATLACLSSQEGDFPGELFTIYFKTYVIPTMVISINNKGSDVTVPMATTLTVLCSAYGARPPSKLTWFFNGREIDDIANTDILPNKKRNGTFDCFSILTYQPEDTNGTITCHSTLNNTKVEKSVHAAFLTFVLPTITLSINGETSSVVNVDNKEAMRVECLVREARPAMVITWFLDDKPISPSAIHTNSSTKRSNGNYDSESSLRLIPSSKVGIISCVCKGLPIGMLTTNITFHSVEQDEIMQRRYIGKLLILVVLASVVLLGFFFICIFICGKGFVARCLRRNNVNLRRAHSISTAVEKDDPFTLDFSESTSLEKPRCDAKRRMSTGPAPPTKKLPDIPEKRLSKYTRAIVDDNEHYYSTMKEDVSNEKLFSRKDICFILNMNTSSIYNRWMGTISTADSKKCVVLTTMKDIMKKSGFHWDEYVKRLLDLPNANHITNIEGICIEEATLYVVHEHLTCEVLENVIGYGQQERESKFLDHLILDTKTSSYATDVLEGMEFIQSYGFLHPGLSTKKVLVTGQKICKLYDFCLREDAPTKVKIIKNKVESNLEFLAPEAVQRSEYDQTSDVWATAVVIWRILYKDNMTETLDFLLSRGHGASSEVKKLDNINFVRCEFLFDCFATDCEQRPSMKALRQSLCQEINHSDTYEVPAGCITDNYVPMKGQLSDSNGSISP